MTDNPAWDAAVEAGARALFEQLGGCADSELMDIVAAICQRDADTAIRAFLATAAEHGWRMVPGVATTQMIWDGNDELDDKGGRFIPAFVAAVRAAPPFAPEKSEVIGGET